ncbi:replication initiation factor domain-containing protein [Chromobacterium violaceum]|uniref:replication initiation factor domain-containing protein n=1 Tax=Chromobacterium violaceum TaxID=536 RepID=UPI001BE885EA|nr:replication initiation factor domain-containing protein [Chromobacterium violaceum]MBT2867683.1 replication initiation factor domain-containing protein [Chromobacterium violaceum]
MGRNSHVVLEAHDVRRETGTEPRYRAVFDPDMPVAMPNMAKKRDLRYWLSLPRIGAWGGAGRDSERQRAARRALPPTSNTGGKSAPQAEAQDLSPELQQIDLVLENGEIKQVMVRAGWGDDLAHIDQVSFTVHESTCHVIAGHMMVADDEYILTMSQRLFQIFGFGVSHKRPKGMNFYRDTWVLGQEDVCYGNLSFGGQRNTMLIQLTATGCNAANSGWEKRLYDFLQHEAENPHLTRVDCAYDDFNGDYNVDVMNEEVRAGRFNCGGRNPFVERHGDWDNPDGSGRTLYVGKRKNGKFCRGYEKGKQLGSPSSNWFRVEVEFKGVDRIIPLEILLNAGSYLAGAYPAFARFKGMKTPERIETIIKGQEYSLDHHLHYAALQVGRLVNYMREVASWSVESIVERLARPEAGYPQRLKLAHISCELGNQDFVHDYAHVDYDTDAFVRMAREEWHAGARFAHA